MNKQLTAQVTAEFIGTFMLVFLGVGAILTAPVDSGALMPALGHGLAIIAIVATYGSISGAHVNPAVSLAAWIGGHLDTQRLGYYMVAQFLGSIAACLVLGVVVSNSGTLGQTVPNEALNISIGQAAVIEAILTFILVSVVYQAAIYGKGGAATPVIIGFTLAACIVAGGALTGASLNPARTLGPALLAGIFDGETQNLLDVVVYLVAILGGGALAALVQMDTFKPVDHSAEAIHKRGKK